MEIKKIISGVFIIAITASSCSIFKKKCDCPKFSKQKNNTEKVSASAAEVKKAHL
ncbi:MAG TPA: hypothetical protein PKN75_02945 [Bacteroidia bacterium]|nr:hypothetical protein [Bacteroidia bacterium]HNU32524.1 hypothetical protein [Bacteroidia bacterium]